jgi:CRISPR-associated endonuclease Cas1
MAASPTLSFPSQSRNLSKTGVLAITGYGLKVLVQSGHLCTDDGFGPERRIIRLPRVGHGLKRLVCISEDGFITLSALKWLADQQASFIMLDRIGKVLLVTGPTAPSDARLRRAQALSHQSGAALEIMRGLIGAKLNGQEELVRDKLKNSASADVIAKLQDGLFSAESLDTVAHVEAQAAYSYWAAWSNVPITFPRQDVKRVPQHWSVFGTRKSILTGSPRLATNPPNAILNYCYALLESESRLAAATLGMDPGMGLLHVDTPARDSLACDIMEAVRPSVDAWLLDWITREPLRRSDFVEEKNGNCRLVPGFAAKLTETAHTWGKLVAPWAEYVARKLWATTSRSKTREGMPTRLTQQHRREAKGSLAPTAIVSPQPDRVCRGCGKSIRAGRSDCGKCAVEGATERLIVAAQIGRISGHTPQALAKEGRTQRQHAKARSAWDASSQPSWLTAEFYSNKIQPMLANASTSAIARRIGISRWYAGRIRQGYRPHPRHWKALAELVGVGQITNSADRRGRRQFSPSTLAAQKLSQYEAGKRVPARSVRLRCRAVG